MSYVDKSLYTSTEPSLTLVDNAENRLILMITKDGRLEAGEGLSHDEASRKFFDILKEHFACRMAELNRENTALREQAEFGANMLEKAAEYKQRAEKAEAENAALREALASAENGLRHGLMMQPVDPFQRGKVISVALDTVRAALKKEARQ